MIRKVMNIWKIQTLVHLFKVTELLILKIDKFDAKDTIQEVNGNYDSLLYFRWKIRLNAAN